MTEGFEFDWQRGDRIGLHEAVLCAGKSRDQIAAILDAATERGEPLLLTRLEGTIFAALAADARDRLDYDPISRTAFLSANAEPARSDRVAIVSAGTSDKPVVEEAARTLIFYGEQARVIDDVGVAGLWRILRHAESLAQFKVVIVVAGMDGALPSVVGGLTPAAVIAVPSSTGYGVAHDGETALASALTSCAPGVVVVNIDNGYGAACAAMRILRAGEANHEG